MPGAMFCPTYANLIVSECSRGSAFNKEESRKTDSGADKDIDNWRALNVSSRKNVTVL